MRRRWRSVRTRARRADDADGDAVKVEEAVDFAFEPDVRIADGEVAASGPGWTITGVHTPGHTSNHMCFAFAEQGVLFPGDHVMGWSTTVVSPPDGDMATYIESLRKVAGRPRPDVLADARPVDHRAAALRRRARRAPVCSANDRCSTPCGPACGRSPTSSPCCTSTSPPSCTSPPAVRCSPTSPSSSTSGRASRPTTTRQADTDARMGRGDRPARPLRDRLRHRAPQDVEGSDVGRPAGRAAGGGPRRRRSVPRASGATPP